MNDSITKNLLSLIAPGEISKSFNVSSIIEETETITIVFEEKEELIPIELQGMRAVLDGFFNPILLQTFPLKDKNVYLKVKRRRWKEKGVKNKSYSNTYNLHRSGMKTTNEFGDFLKAELGLQPSEYNKLWESPATQG